SYRWIRSIRATGARLTVRFDESDCYIFAGRDDADRSSRELGEIVDAERLLELGDLCNGVLEAVLAEHLALFVLEQVAHLLVRLLADDPPDLRKQHGVLTRRVGAIHVVEAPHRAGERGAVGKLPLRERRDLLGERAAGLMLPPQRLGELDELACLLKPRK